MSSRRSNSSRKSTSKSSRSSSSRREKKTSTTKDSSIPRSRNGDDPKSRMDALLAKKTFNWDEEELAQFSNELCSLVYRNSFDEQTSKRAKAKMRTVAEVSRCIKLINAESRPQDVAGCGLKYYKQRLVLMAENFLGENEKSKELKEKFTEMSEPKTAIPLKRFDYITQYFSKNGIVASSWENLNWDEQVTIIAHLIHKRFTVFGAYRDMSFNDAQWLSFYAKWHLVRGDLLEEENKKLKTELAKLKKTTDKSARSANRSSNSKSASEKIKSSGGKSKRVRTRSA